MPSLSVWVALARPQQWCAPRPVQLHDCWQVGMQRFSLALLLGTMLAVLCPDPACSNAYLLVTPCTLMKPGARLQLQVAVSNDMHERAMALAARQGKSMSHVISEAVERGLVATK